MQQLEQFQILGSGDHEFHCGKVVRINGKNIRAAGHGNEALDPPRGQGFKDVIAEDIGMIAMTQMKRMGCPKGFLEHASRGFIKWLGTKVRIKGAGKRTITPPQIGE